jgi:hypothetical protein
MIKENNILRLMKNKSEKCSPSKYAHLGIESVLTQYFQLIKADTAEIETTMFLKNRNPISKNIPLASISKVIGEVDLKEELQGKELLYTDFPRWNKFNEEQTSLEDFIPKKEKGPFSFKEAKSVLIIPIQKNNHYWGNIVCIGPESITWTLEVKSISKVFTELFNNMLQYFHNQEKNLFLINNVKQQLNNKTEIIETLQETIKAKNEVIAKLKGEEQAAEFVWDETAEAYDEVWVTVHGFKNGSPEPTVSKWEKITERKTLLQVNDLFFAKANTKKAV